MSKKVPVSRGPMLSRSAGRLALVLALAGASFYLFRSLTVHRLASAQVAVTPFTVWMEAYQYGPNPRPQLFSQWTVARRSDGTTAKVESFGPLSWGQVGREIDYADGSSIHLFDFARVKSSFLKPPELVTAPVREQLLNPPGNCVVPGYRLVSDRDLILNQAVAEVEVDGPEMTQVTDWRAPGLGCQSLQYTVKRRHADGSRTLVTEAKPVRLQVGKEPSARLFDPGTDYQEMAPSQAVRMLFEKMGRPLSPDDPALKSVERFDKTYLAQN